MIRQLLATAVCTFTIWSCASQIGPSGGEVDKIPPEIIFTYPADKTVNFNDNYVTIEFSEYVDKRSVQEAIFISPAIDGTIEYDWSGKELEISFEDSLRKDITYSITVGTDVIDLNNRNNMSSSFSFTFSTGDEIDNGQVKGKVYDKDALGTLIFAYSLTDTIPNPASQKPDYLSQVGTKGEYWLRGMSPGNYRIFAVKDVFRDLLYNATDDMYGVLHRDIAISKIDSLVTGLNFLLSIEDTTAPAISGITNTDRNHILVEFTEAIDSVKLSSDNFFIYDSSELREHSIDLFYKDGQKSTNYFVCFNDSLIFENNNYLIARGVFDKKGNELVYESVSFVVSEKFDTLAPSVKSISTEYSQNVFDFENPYVELIFDDAIVLSNVTRAFNILSKDSVEQEINFVSVNGAIKRIEIAKAQKPNSEFKLIVDYKFIEDIAGNKKDTTYSNKLTAISELEFSAVSGFVSTTSEQAIILNLWNISDNKTMFLSKLQENKSFKFSRVKPGLYSLMAFVDANNNDKLDRGSLDPFQFSEQFIYYPDTLKLNARWPVGDVQIEFDNQ